MSDAQFLRWFPFLFPFLFAGGWLAITAMLGLMSGWYNLQQWYADEAREEPLLRLRGQSGVMGLGVALNNCLTLAACRSGLSIRIWRIFGPFQKPLLVPWSEITAEPTRTWFTPMVRLRLGGEGRLKLAARSWSRLVAAAGVAANGGAASGAVLRQVPPITGRAVARGMILEWLAVTALGAAFFYFAPQLLSDGPPWRLPLAWCIAFPAVVVGLAQLIRYAREG